MQFATVLRTALSECKSPLLLFLLPGAAFSFFSEKKENAAQCHGHHHIKIKGE
jgi:hypothetical protein